MTRPSDVLSFIIVIALAIGLHKYAHLDATAFIACSALWYGIRAWSRAGDVNTAYNKISGEG